MTTPVFHWLGKGDGGEDERQGETNTSCSQLRCGGGGGAIQDAECLGGDKENLSMNLFPTNKAKNRYPLERHE